MNFTFCIGGEECGIIPDPTDLPIVEEQLTNSKNMRFISQATENFLKETLLQHDITSISLENAFSCYMTLINDLKDARLEFEYS